MSNSKPSVFARFFGLNKTETLKINRNNLGCRSFKVCKLMQEINKYGVMWPTHTNKFYYYPLANVSDIKKPKCTPFSLRFPENGHGKVVALDKVNIKEGIIFQKTLGLFKSRKFIKEYYPDDSDLLMAIGSAFETEVGLSESVTYDQYQYWMKDITDPIVRKYMDEYYGVKLRQYMGELV